MPTNNQYLDMINSVLPTVSFVPPDQQPGMGKQLSNFTDNSIFKTEQNQLSTFNKEPRFSVNPETVNPPSNVGISNDTSSKVDLPTFLGTLAHAIGGDETFGGRLGKSIVGMRRKEQEQQLAQEELGIRRTATESEAQKRLADIETSKSRLGIAQSAEERAAAETSRKANVSRLTALKRLPGLSSEDQTAIDSAIRGLATPAEQASLGLVTQPSIKLVKDENGNFVYSANPVGMQGPTPATELPTNVFLESIDAKGNPVYATGVTRGPGVGSITPTNVPAALTRDERETMQAIRSLKQKNVDNPTEAEIATERGNLFPKGGKKKESLLDVIKKAEEAKQTPPGAATTVPVPAGKVRVRRPDGKVGFIDSSKLKAAIAKGWEEVK